MKKFDAVIFDMDGVIFDSERCVLGCWESLAEKYGMEDLEKTYYECTGTTVERTREILLDAYGADFPYEQYMAEASVLFHERYDGGRLPMKEGVVELLSFLKDEKKKIGLASSTRRETVLSQLGEAGILPYFDEVITGDMAGRSKPAPDIYLLACEKVGADPREAYAIEDSYNGIRAAAAGGLRPIMVPDLRGPDGEMESLSERVLPSLSEVLLYLKD